MDLKVSTAQEVKGRLVNETEQRANYDKALAMLKANITAFSKSSSRLSQLIGEKTECGERTGIKKEMGEGEG